VYGRVTLWWPYDGSLGGNQPEAHRSDRSAEWSERAPASRHPADFDPSVDRGLSLGVVDGIHVPGGLLLLSHVSVGGNGLH
jgi:hypothetical protein